MSADLHRLVNKQRVVATKILREDQPESVGGGHPRRKKISPHVRQIIRVEDSEPGAISVEHGVVPLNNDDRRGVVLRQDRGPPTPEPIVWVRAVIVVGRGG